MRGHPRPLHGNNSSLNIPPPPRPVSSINTALFAATLVSRVIESFPVGPAPVQGSEVVWAGDCFGAALPPRC